MVSTQVLGRAVVDDVRAMFQRPLEVRAHHGVVYHDNCILALLLHEGANPRDINYLEQRVRRRLQKHHGGLARVEVWDHTLRLRRIYMVHRNTHVRPEVGEQTVGAAVQVVTRDDLYAWLEQARDDVQCGHAA